MNKRWIKVVPGILAVVFIILTVSCGNDKADTEMDAIKASEAVHVELRLKKARVIKASMIDQTNPPVFYAARKSHSGNIVYLLSRKPEMSIRAIDETNAVLSRFYSQGEGPGQLRFMLRLQALKRTLIAVGMDKVIYFDLKEGRLLKESPFTKHFDYTDKVHFIDENNYICVYSERDENGESVRIIASGALSGDSGLKTICRDDGRNDMGTTRIQYSNLYHEMITPDYHFVFLPVSSKVVCAVSDSNTLVLKDMLGKEIKSLTIDYKPRAWSQKELDYYLESIKKVDDPVLYNGLKSKARKTWFTIMSMIPLPGDHFLVYLGDGYRKYQFKVFNRDLKHICDISFPEEVISRLEDLRALQFFSEGLYFIDNSGDESQYVEYIVQNLPKVFGPVPLLSNSKL